MIKRNRIIGSAFFLLVIILTCVNAGAHTTIVVSSTNDLLKTIRSLERGLIVYIKAKNYVLYDTLRIRNSNVSIIGEPGTKLILANNINKPVISIGSQEEIVAPDSVIKNVTLSNIEIDGNKDNQTSETQINRPWIRNNGIDVRGVSKLTIENVISNNNRSGGLVISNKCSDIHVINSKFSNNYYDGVAYYDSERIFTQSSSMLNNNGAGISLDLDITDSIFSNCILDANKDVGIFARFASELRFNNCVIKNSGNWAVFLGHDEDDNGVRDLMFSGCQILNNAGGIWMSSPREDQSSYNSVAGCVFRGNEQSNIRTEGSVIYEAGNIEMP